MGKTREVKLTKEQYLKIFNKIYEDFVDNTPLHFYELEEKTKMEFIENQLLNLELGEQGVIKK